MSRTIFFLRHGETDHNAESRLQGQLDVALNARGRAQGESVGRDLAAILQARGLDPAAPPFFVSPLSRAVETARLARSAMGLAPDAFTPEPRLMELHFGAWQNLTWPEIRARDGGAVAARDRDRWNVAPPGGESYAGAAARALDFLEAAPQGPLVLVSHGGIARALLVRLAGAPVGAAMRERIVQGRVLAFENGGYAWLSPPAGLKKPR